MRNRVYVEGDVGQGTIYEEWEFLWEEITVIQSKLNCNWKNRGRGTGKEISLCRIAGSHPSDEDVC